MRDARWLITAADRLVVRFAFVDHLIVVGLGQLRIPLRAGGYTERLAAERTRVRSGRAGPVSRAQRHAAPVTWQYSPGRKTSMSLTAGGPRYGRTSNAIPRGS